MRTLLISLLIALAAGLAIASPAYAYNETSATVDPADCEACHGKDAPIARSDDGAGRQGPHGAYGVSTTKCDNCHSVHEAPTGFMLLPGATIQATCEVCHDGTGGEGVYGTIEARTGVAPASSHDIDQTNVIPGGDPSTGGDANGSFSSASGNLTCTDCHSPHGNDTVESFTGDRWRVASDTSGYDSDRLLKQRPGNSATSTPVYGSDWCASCHRGRVDAGSLHNHPVETSATAGNFTYQNLQVLTGVGASTTTTGTLGQSNFGYVMPYPRTSGQGTHKPICQQCHEDGRNVGDATQGTVSAGEVFEVTRPDGEPDDPSPNTDNPRFQTFPHESAVPRMLVEPEDDLCLNCHPSGQLP